MACAVDNVADDRARGRQLACASAVEYDIAYRVAAHENRVENIVNARKLAVVIDECGADYRIDVLAVLALARSAEKLYNSAPVLGVFDILECYLGYALGVNLVGIDMLAEAQGRENAYLAAGVEAENIRRGVALGIAVVLRELERVFKRHAVVYHAGENKIRRAVENAREFVYLVCGEALAYRSDYRYSAADRRFKEEIHIVLCGVSEQLAALRRDKLFVRGHNALARLEAGGDELIRRMKPAHRLDNDLYLGVVENNIKIFYKKLLIRVARKILEVENIFYLKLRLRALAHDAVVIFVDDLGNAASDNAVAHYRYIHDNCLPTVIGFYYFITNSPGDKDPKENFLIFL